MQISVKHDLDKLQRNLNDFQKKQLPKATWWALNQTGARVGRQMVKEVAKEAGVSQKDLKRRGFYVTARAKLKDLVFEVRSRYGAIPLKDFKPVQTKNGVRARAWGQKKVYEGAFIVNSIGRHVFKRRTGKRLPIDKLHGPIPFKMFEAVTTQQRAIELLKRTFPERLAKGLERYTRGRG
jgi:hypothetical protein